MLELAPSDLAIVACHGDEAALAGWRSVLAPLHVQIAPDEVWLLGTRADRGGMMTDATARLPAALVLDQTDGWAGFFVTGSEMAELIAGLTIVPIETGQPALLQGAIAGVAGKLLVGGEGCHLLVPAPAGDYVRARILAVGADLGIRPAGAGVSQLFMPSP